MWKKLIVVVVLIIIVLVVVYYLTATGDNDAPPPANTNPLPVDPYAQKQWYAKPNLGGGLSHVDYWNFRDEMLSVPSGSMRTAFKDQMILKAKEHITTNDPLGERMNAFFWNNNGEIWFVKVAPGQFGGAAPGGTLYIYDY